VSLSQPTNSPAQNRSPGLSVQELLRSDSRPVPPLLLAEGYEDMGSDDIPKESFYSREWHELEMERLWRRTWQMACREEELAKVGDHVVYNIGQDSLIVARTAPDRIQAFYNACLHRGRRLSDGDGHVRNFRCQFHGFAWNLDGSLRDVPCGWDFPHVKPEKFRLPEARVGTWGGFVFVCMSHETEELEEFLGPLTQHFATFPLEERYIELHVVKELPANWKVVLEAFIESFHVIATHAQGAKRMGAVNTQYDNYGERHNFNRMISPKGMASAHLAQEFTDEEIIRGGSKPAVEKVALELLSEGLGARAALAQGERTVLNETYGVDLDEKSDCEIIDTIQYWLFPNFCPWGNFANPFAYRFRPNGDDPDTSLMDLYILPAVEKGKVPPPAAPVYLGLEQGWDEAAGISPGLAFILNQDTGNLAGVQAGLKTSRKPGITLANYQESRIRHFHHLLDRYVRGGDAE